MHVSQNLPIPPEEVFNNTLFSSHIASVHQSSLVCKNEKRFVSTRCQNDWQLFGWEKAFTTMSSTRRLRWKSLILNRKGTNRFWRVGLFMVSCSPAVSKALWIRHSCVDDLHFMKIIENKTDYTNVNSTSKALHNWRTHGTNTVALHTLTSVRIPHYHPLLEQKPWGNMTNTNKHGVLVVHSLIIPLVTVVEHLKTYRYPRHPVVRVTQGIT